MTKNKTSSKPKTAAKQETGGGCPVATCSAFCRLAWEKARELESQRDCHAEESEYQKAAECDTAARTLYELLAEIRSLPNAKHIHPEPTTKDDTNQ